MSVRELMVEYPDDFSYYAEQILDSYFGNIFVTLNNEKIIYVNEKMAASIHMTKEELTGLTLAELRSRKLWIRSVSQELEERKAPFDAYNVSKWGDEIFTHVEPIYDREGNMVMGVHFTIPKKMLDFFLQYIDTEKTNLSQYEDIVNFMEIQKNGYEKYIYKSPIAAAAFQKARDLRHTDSTILIYGETGTGKDVLANYIYEYSERSNKPFIPVNCSAIPVELIESEFFGYDRGAFTGARSNGKPGFFEMADQGTLFLDEIGELPLSTQAKLLRVLETGDIMRVGGTSVKHTDVRIIAATNMNLQQMVEEHKFREDLYYRLNIIPFYLPPLREREEDIQPLIDHFLAIYNRKHKQQRVLTDEMTAKLLAYPWPGNIRELRNVIERFVITNQINIDTIFPNESDAETQSTECVVPPDLPLHEACAKFEQDYIQRALDACGGSVAKAADMLGIHRSLLYKKLKKETAE